MCGADPPSWWWCGAQTCPPSKRCGTQTQHCAQPAHPGSLNHPLFVVQGLRLPGGWGSLKLHVSRAVWRQHAPREALPPPLLCRVLYTVPKWKFTKHFRGSGKGGQLLGSVILTPQSTPAVTGSLRSTIHSVYSFIHQAFIPVYAAMGLLWVLRIFRLKDKHSWGQGW